MNAIIEETVIRPPADEAEINAMTSIRVLAAIEEYTTPEGPDEHMVRDHYVSESSDIAERISSGEYSSLCAKTGKHIIGMCVWSQDNQSGAKIEYLYVAPNQHGRGVGSLLLGNALNLIGDTTYISLHTHSAQPFYEKWGFKRTNKYHTDEITHEQEMVLEPKTTTMRK